MLLAVRTGFFKWTLKKPYKLVSMEMRGVDEAVWLLKLVQDVKWKKKMDKVRLTGNWRLLLCNLIISSTMFDIVILTSEGHWTWKSSARKSLFCIFYDKLPYNEKIFWCFKNCFRLRKEFDHIGPVYTWLLHVFSLTG